ncbi:reverse transcriptase [Elysia marginata]|uniref:Reverse transcriptase n=1 Tax=Elysia marginata TaxID=1093978 RepID=A0AAV4IWI9_9GAST|nr:reverse transcriptase [Elysia marginata]
MHENWYFEQYDDATFSTMTPSIPPRASRNTPTPHSRQRGGSVAKRERAILAQLRCKGKSPILQKYLHDIGASPCDACLQCGQSPDDLHHALYDCPEVDFFWSLIPGDPMESLWESPVEMIEFLRASQRLPIA